MKEAKKMQVTDQICKQVQLMRKGGANQTEIGKLLGISSPTISRIEKAGYDVNVYLENKRIAREKEKTAKETVTVELYGGPDKIGEVEEQVAGQIEMELPQKEPEEKQEQDRIVKLMRFQAHEVDKIVKSMSECFDLLIVKVDKLNDTLNMVLKAIRRE